MAFAARGMSRVTYRDADSLTYMEGIGAGRPEATVCPDVVFAHPPPDAAEPAPTAGRVTVGVGVMAYGGWSNPGEGDVYQRYLAMLTEVVTGIVQAGDAVRLLVGQPIDLPTAQLLLSGLSPEIAAQVEPAEFREMPGLLETVGQCDLVVATRYHNVVAALLMRRPVVSLSYAPKNAVLLRDVGMSEFDRRVEDADAGWVLARVRGLRSGKARLPADADARLTDWGSRVRAEVARVSETYPSPST